MRTDRRCPLVVSLFGIWSKKSGYARLDAGSAAPKIERAVWLDKRSGEPAKAKKRGHLRLYSCRGSTIRPTTSSADAAPRRTRSRSATTNPFQSNFAWGRAELVEYKTRQGRAAARRRSSTRPTTSRGNATRWSSTCTSGCRTACTARRAVGSRLLQCCGLHEPRLFLPAAGHRVPSARARTVGRRLRRFRRSSRSSPWARSMPAKVGIVGHSWGGFDASFLATHTERLRRGGRRRADHQSRQQLRQPSLGSGIAETDHIETGQQRMEVPLYEDLQAYIRNSAVFGVSTMKTPLLLMFGDNDGTVHWHQGVELYNIARRAGKERRDARLRRRRSRPAQEAEPDRLSPSHPAMVRSLPERRAGGALDHRAAVGSRS